MKYYCEFCCRLFDNEDKCIECENTHRKEIENIKKQPQLKKEYGSIWNGNGDDNVNCGR